MEPQRITVFLLLMAAAVCAMAIFVANLLVSGAADGEPGSEEERKMKLRDRILAILQDRQTAHPNLELLADEIVAAVREKEGDNVLSAYWSRKNRQFIFHWPPGGQPDVHLVSYVLAGIGIGTGGLACELQDRGYDIETLEFRIERREGT